MSKRKWIIIAATVLVGGGLVAEATRRLRQRHHTPPVAAASPHAVAGSFHQHSDMSRDSNRNLASIVETARSHNLSFVVLTDHNNQYAGPMSRDDVVILSYAELSTVRGHLVALGATDTPSDDERQQPGTLAALRASSVSPIITHPNDPKRPWTGPWDNAAGLEIANFASSVRSRGGFAFVGLAPLLLAGSVNRDLATLQFYDRDTRALARWDEVPDPTFGGFCGQDVHGGLGLDDALQPYTLVLDGPWPEAKAMRPAWILEQLKIGRFTCNAAPIGKALRIDLQADGMPDHPLRVGETGVLGSQVTARALGSVPGAILVLLRNGLVVERSLTGEVHHTHPSPGTYRAELWLAVPNLFYGSHLIPVAYSGRLRLTAESVTPNFKGKGNP